MGLFTNRRDDIGNPEGAADLLEQFRATEEPEAASTPKRRLEDNHPAQESNVEIDVAGFLDMLGVAQHSDLDTISSAWKRFLADHQPLDTDDAEAAVLKEQIRRKMNTAYASFRLTRAA